MKYAFTLMVMFIQFTCFSQCEDRDASGSASFHYTKGKASGWGGELGQQGLISNFSFFIGLDITRIKGGKSGDSIIKRQDLIYLKGIYRVYQSRNEALNIGLVAAPALMGPWLEVLTGTRILYVTGRHTALSVEPLYYMVDKTIHINLNIHFLL